MMSTRGHRLRTSAHDFCDERFCHHCGVRRWLQTLLLTGSFKRMHGEFVGLVADGLVQAYGWRLISEFWKIVCGVLENRGPGGGF